MVELLGTLGSIFLTVIVPLFALIGLGWGIDRKFGFHLETLVKLTIYVFVPAFVFVRLVESTLEPGLLPRLATATLIVIIGMAILSVLAARLRGDPPATLTAMMLATMFYNCGNFGVPAIGLAFGPRAAELQVFVLVTMNIATFTVGTLIATWHHDTSGWRKMLPMLRQPAVYAVVLALVLRETNLRPVEWPIWVPLRMLADGTLGFMLLVLGVQLSKIKPNSLKDGLGAVVVIRLLLGPAIAFGAALAMGFDKETTKILVLGAGAPAAINTALLAHEFKADTRLASAAVFYTTLLSLVTVTIVLAILRAW